MFKSFCFSLVFVVFNIGCVKKEDGLLLPEQKNNTTTKNLYVGTDPETKCQYLISSKGGITPRLDRSGRQICN